MKDFFLSLLCIAAVFMAVYLRADELPLGRLPVPVESVVKALDKTGVKITRQQVQFLSKVTSSEPQAELMVRNIQSERDNIAAATVQCVDRRACLPFVVFLHWPSRETMQSAISAIGLKKTTVTQSAKPLDWLTKPGDHATLLLEAKGIRISTPVICLERGVQRQKIRVRTADRKHIYVAEILERGLLRSTL